MEHTTYRMAVGETLRFVEVPKDKKTLPDYGWFVPFNFHFSNIYSGLLYLYPYIHNIRFVYLNAIKFDCIPGCTALAWPRGPIISLAPVGLLHTLTNYMIGVEAEVKQLYSIKCIDSCGQHRLTILCHIYIYICMCIYVCAMICRFDSFRG